MKCVSAFSCRRFQDMHDNLRRRIFPDGSYLPETQRANPLGAPPPSPVGEDFRRRSMSDSPRSSTPFSADSGRPNSTSPDLASQRAATRIPHYGQFNITGVSPIPSGAAQSPAAQNRVRFAFPAPPTPSDTLNSRGPLRFYFANMTPTPKVHMARTRPPTPYPQGPRPILKPASSMSSGGRSPIRSSNSSDSSAGTTFHTAQSSATPGPTPAADNRSPSSSTGARRKVFGSRK